MSDEYIKKDDAIELLNNSYVHEDDRHNWREHNNDCIDKLIVKFKELPPADVVERKQGEWVGEGDGYYNGELVYDTWYCSNCDYIVDDEEYPSWNFCPNCGARMKGMDND